MYDQGLAEALVTVVRLRHEDGAVNTNPQLAMRMSGVHFEN
jgi:hypothetical protein